MPTYNFRNVKTNEDFSEFMSIAARETYLEENPDIIQVLSMPAIVDPVGAGITRPPTEFLKNVIGKVKAHNPHSTALERRWNIPREW